MLNIDDFDKYAHNAIDWVKDYYSFQENEYPIQSQVKSNEIFNLLKSKAPKKGEDFNLILQDFNEIIMPGISHWQNPNFYGYFPSNTSFESMIGEILSNALGVVNFTWETSPAATELEERVMQWLRDMIGLPHEFEGVIHDTASTATLTAIMTALNKITDGKIHEDGFDGKKYRIYCSDEAHSSVEKGAIMAGIGKKNVVKIELDEKYAMKSEKLRDAIEKDLKRGYVPFCIVSAIGTTGSLAVDPLEEIGTISNEFNLWLHIDAAFSGSALILEEYRHWLNGIDFVDSFVFNPHKWLFTNFDYSAFFIKDKHILQKTFSIHPEYLKFDEDEQVNNYKDWGIQLGRRFRALKMWFVIRSFGVEGLKNKIREHIGYSNWIKNKIEANPNFEIMAPVDLTLICFRIIKEGVSEEKLNEINKEYLSLINKSGEVFLTHTKLSGKFVIRIAIGKTYANQSHIENLLNCLEKNFEKI